MPDPKAEFWSTLRSDFLNARDAVTESVIQDIAEAAAKNIADPEEASLMYRIATGQAPALRPLPPLISEWKGSLRLAQKTIDQQCRDVSKMSEQFKHLAALSPQKVKLWTDRLIAGGSTAASLGRMMGSCRSFWRYLQDSGTLPVDAPDPFAGSFRLAAKRAVRNTVNRQSFQPEELARVYGVAAGIEDLTLSRLIALGAYTGARIEELCSLTVNHCENGMFRIADAKTAAGVRQVPIHPALSNIVTTLMASAKEDGYLIPSAAAGKYGVRSDPYSKRFGRLKESLKFGPEHVFHSIRKTVATMLEQSGVQEGIAADILGHEKKTISYGLYSSGSSVQQKQEAILRLAYPAPLNSP